MTLKLHTKPFLAAAAALLPLGAAQAWAPERPAPIYREGEVVVRYRAGATVAEVQASKARLGLAARRSIDRRRTELVALPRFTTTAAALAVLRADPAVELAEPNFLRYRRAVVPNDALFPQQWGLRNTGQGDFFTGLPGTAGADLNMDEAWDANGDGTADRTGSASVIVAVIDDAIQTGHPDLTPNVLPGRNFIACQNRPDNPNPLTSQGQHGTLVSGCVAGRGNNSAGVAGVAWNTGLLPLKFGFDTATHIEALEYARDNGAKIINASFGGPGFSQAERDLIASLAADDILYVAASGNDDSNTDVAQLNYPANYDADNIVAVAATDRRDDITSFSQYGPLTTDVAAPGVQIVTTSINSNYSSNGVAGTSFSSPYTAGVAALLKAHVAPTPDFMEMKARLIESGTAVGGGNPKQMTSGGRVDADAALDMAARPALVVSAVAYDAAGNDVLDPGETVDVAFTVRNLWQDATNVTATLDVDDAGVTINSGAQALGTIAALDDATATFSVTVAGGITEHRYLHFTLSLAADGPYAAQRAAIAEIGTLTDGDEITQPFSGDIYDDYHAWHIDVPALVGTKTLFVRTTTPSSSFDIDLLVKRDAPPQYSITVGINPETEAGFFCTSGTAPNCQDPDTLQSARLDGIEEVSVVNPAPGTYHAVVVNFEQLVIPLNYTLEAEILDGDLRPDDFNFTDITGVPAGTYDSDPLMIVGLSAPTRITVVGGQYNINGGTFTAAPGAVANGDTVRLRANAGSGSARVQVTIGGVTDTFLVNLFPSSGNGPGAEQDCDAGGGGGGRGGGGRVPLPALAVLALAVLARRLRAA